MPMPRMMIKRSSSFNDCREDAPSQQQESESPTQTRSSSSPSTNAAAHNRTTAMSGSIPHKSIQGGGGSNGGSQLGRVLPPGKVTRSSSDSSANSNNVGTNNTTINNRRKSLQLISSPAETISPTDDALAGRLHKSDPSVCFMSDPSVSEEEEFPPTVGSSQADFQKKLLYRQRLREFDAMSVGDTSLSSSNMSPTPQRFRIQFDHGVGKVRNKIKAASARLSFNSKMMQSEAASHGDSGSRTIPRSPLDGSSSDELLPGLIH